MMSGDIRSGDIPVTASKYGSFHVHSPDHLSSEAPLNLNVTALTHTPFNELHTPSQNSIYGWAVTVLKRPSLTVR